MSSYNYWSEDDECLIRKLAGTMSFEKMALSYFPHRTPVSLQKKALKLKLVSGFRHKTHSHDVDFWKKTTSETSYYAGVIAADGNLHKVRSLFNWSIASKDVCLLEQFKRACQFTGNIRTYSRLKYKAEGSKDVSTLTIAGCGEWYKDLSSIWNITPAKTFTLSPPNLSDDTLILSFLTGYLDGDGWLTARHGGKHHRNTIRVGYCSASLPFLQWVGFQFDRLFPVIRLPSAHTNPTISSVKPARGNYYNYHIEGFRAVTIFNTLRQLPIPRLARKWDKPEAVAILDYYKNKYPSHFPNLVPNLSKLV